MVAIPTELQLTLVVVVSVDKDSFGALVIIAHYLMKCFCLSAINVTTDRIDWLLDSHRNVLTFCYEGLREECAVWFTWYSPERWAINSNRQEVRQCDDTWWTTIGKNCQGTEGRLNMLAFTQTD
jgi:hypothetical protein